MFFRQLVETLLVGPFLGLFFGLIGGLFVGLLFGLGIGLAGLAYGWWACIIHGLLRVALWRTGVLPLNLVPFLDYATERILLRRVGGGYLFIHPLLLTYFAEE